MGRWVACRSCKYMDFRGAGREDWQNECTDISLTCKCSSQSTDHKELQNASLHLLLNYFVGMKKKNQTQKTQEHEVLPFKGVLYEMVESGIWETAALYQRDLVCPLLKMLNTVCFKIHPIL